MGQLRAIRERKSEHRDFLLEFGWNLECRRNQDHRLEAILQMKSDLLQLANYREVVLREEWVKVFEQEDRRFNLLNHLVQRRQRIFRGCVPVLLRLQRRSAGNNANTEAPFENLL